MLPSVTSRSSYQHKLAVIIGGIPQVDAIHQSISSTPSSASASGFCERSSSRRLRCRCALMTARASLRFCMLTVWLVPAQVYASRGMTTLSMYQPTCLPGSGKWVSLPTTQPVERHQKATRSVACSSGGAGSPCPTFAASDQRHASARWLTVVGAADLAIDTGVPDVVPDELLLVHEALLVHHRLLDIHDL